MLATPKTKGDLFLASSLCDGLEDTNIQQVTTLLLSKDADPNILIPTHGITPFHLVIGNASESFAVEVTKLFLRHGGNPNVRSIDGMTPVHVAAAWGRVDVLELLLANGGDPLQLDDDGRSPFHYAFDGNYYEAITVLGKYCSRSIDDDVQPKYKMSLDKILVDNGDIMAEYIVPEDSFIKVEHSSLSKILSINNNYTERLTSNVEESNIRNLYKNITNTTLSYEVDPPYMTTALSTSIDSFEIRENLEDKQDSRENLARLQRFHIDKNVEKERLLISEIINHLSTTLTSDSTIDEMLFAQMKSNKKETHKKGGISPIPFLQEKKFPLTKTKKEYMTPKFRRRKFLQDHPIKYSTSSKCVSEKKDMNTHTYMSSCSLDHSIISTSPNFYTPLNMKKESKIKTSYTNKHSSPKKDDHDTSFTTPCRKKQNNLFFEFDKLRKATVCTTPRRKQYRPRVSYKISKQSNVMARNGDILKNHASKLSYKGKLHRKMVKDTSYSDEIPSSSDTSALSFSPEYLRSSKFDKRYSNNLAVRLHEGRYDDNIDVLSHESTNQKLINASLSSVESENEYFKSNNLKLQNIALALTKENEYKINCNINNNKIDKRYKEIKCALVPMESKPINYTSFENKQNEEKGINTLMTDNTKLSNFNSKSEELYSSISYVSVQEEYRYEDLEKGVVFVERRICATTGSIYDESKEPEFNSSKENVTTSSKRSLNFPSELLLIDNYTLRQRLTELGDAPGPITHTTKHLYLKRLITIQNTINKNALFQENIENRSKDKISQIKPWLTFGDWINDLDMYKTLERNVFKEFVSPDPTRKWREGTSKTSFNYLLLDPRITQDLPRRRVCLAESEIWSTFLSAIFYIGKGKRSRPYSHLYDAFNIWVSKEEKSLNKKMKCILDIWNEGFGVICLHVFQNTIPVEAYTREAAMIDALGLDQLGNCKSGEYYGVAATWNMKDKCKFGRYLLYRAMQILMYEGERQLFPEHL